MRRQIDLGILYSRSGTYRQIGEAAYAGAMAGIAAVNQDSTYDLSFTPVERDPGGNLDLYPSLCDDILANSSARHVIGCVTSSSRKEVIPVIERAGATLWYSAPYEGFEASDHVVYMHGCPNQHLLPLLEYAVPNFGKRAYLIGSNYIWGWEMGRLARELITDGGGDVLGERYLPLGALDIDRVIDEIRYSKPDFILNSLVGTSSYQFLAAMQDLGHRDERFAPSHCPILSCNLTECELATLGDAAEGLISVGPYFKGVRQTTSSWAGDGSFGSSYEAASYASVLELARLLNEHPGSELLRISKLLEFSGSDIINKLDHHRSLPVLIAQVEKGEFHVLQHRGIIAADPYLSRRRSQHRPPIDLKVIR